MNTCKSTLSLQLKRRLQQCVIPRQNCAINLHNDWGVLKVIFTVLLIAACLSFTSAYAQLKQPQHCPPVQEITKKTFPAGCTYQYGSNWQSEAAPIKNCEDPKKLSFSIATAIVTASPKDGTYTVNQLFCIYHFKDQPGNPVLLKSAPSLKLSVTLTGSWKVQQANLLACTDSQQSNCPFFLGE